MRSSPVRPKQAQPRQVRKKAAVSLPLVRYGQLGLFLFPPVGIPKRQEPVRRAPTEILFSFIQRYPLLSVGDMEKTAYLGSHAPAGAGPNSGGREIPQNI